ncbi:hypothetical protein WG909_05580 [Peptostreptococcaceae bacterium AGR-M142]
MSLIKITDINFSSIPVQIINLVFLIVLFLVINKLVKTYKK